MSCLQCAASSPGPCPRCGAPAASPAANRRAAAGVIASFSVVLLLIVLRVPLTQVERERRSCEGGGARDCLNIGLHHERGTGAAKDPARALGYFRRACELGLAVGCSFQADLLSWGHGEGDQALITALYRRACDGGHAHACAQAAERLKGGRGAPRDLDAARALLLAEQLGLSGHIHFEKHPQYDQ